MDDKNNKTRIQRLIFIIMENIFTPEDIKKLKTFKKFLQSQRLSSADIEVYQGDYEGAWDGPREGEMDYHFSNKWNLEVPSFIIPLINKTLKVAKEKYDDLVLDISEDLTYERIDFEYDIKEDEINVFLFGSYYGRDEGSGVSWELSEDESLSEVFDSLKELESDSSLLELRYNGGGDSGYVEGAFETGELVPADIEDWCYRQLEDHFGGWEINEGSDGTFYFDLDKNTIELSHTYNTEENIKETLFSQKIS